MGLLHLSARGYGWREADMLCLGVETGPVSGSCEEDVCMALLQSSVVLVLFLLCWLHTVPLQGWGEKTGTCEGNYCPPPLVNHPFPSAHVHRLWKQMRAGEEVTVTPRSQPCPFQNVHFLSLFSTSLGCMPFRGKSFHT